MGTSKMKLVTLTAVVTSVFSVPQWPNGPEKTYPYPNGEKTYPMESGYTNMEEYGSGRPSKYDHHQPEKKRFDMDEWMESFMNHLNLSETTINLHNTINYSARPDADGKRDGLSDMGYGKEKPEGDMNEMKGYLQQMMDKMTSKNDMDDMLNYLKEKMEGSDKPGSDSENEGSDHGSKGGSKGGSKKKGKKGQE